MPMSDILPTHVREWVTEMTAAGMTPATVRHVKIILSAIFTTALNDFIVVIHACRGVKSPTVPVKEFRIVTPAEYIRLQDVLPGDISRLLVDVDIGSGLRWGELTELRPRDLHLSSGILTVSRAVVELDPKFHPQGGRFHVKDYPKSKRPRRFKLEPDLITALSDHVDAHRLGVDDLLFSFGLFERDMRPRPTLVDVTSLGLTEPNTAGRRYQHGTSTAYTAGTCRCEHCRAAVARYRADRRVRGLDSPRGQRRRDTDPDGHLSRDWYRLHVWYPACDQAGLSDPRPRMHDLRHSHASWLLAGGADLQVVKERMGHGSIVTTEKYLHTLPTADETALAALQRIRRS